MYIYIYYTQVYYTVFNISLTLTQKTEKPTIKIAHVTKNSIHFLKWP